MLAPAKNGYLVVNGVERFDEIRQMEDHSRWVGITFFPLKRTTEDWKATEYGMLLCVRGRVDPVVYAKGSRVVVSSYSTFDDMLDDGWRVD